MQRERDITQMFWAAQLTGERMPVLFWMARPDMSCEYVSPSWLEFTGCALEQVLGDGWSRGLHPEDLARWLDTCVRALDARAPFEIEYRLLRRDGEYRWMLDRAIPRHSSEGAFLGHVGACVDIHDRKRAENELARSLERERKLRLASEEVSRLKDAFLASVLRDMRFAAQAIVTWAAHLRGEPQAQSEAAQAFDSIERHARAQHRIISDLLDLARAAAGQPQAPVGCDEQALLAGIRVLVVDDDARARDTIVKVLGIAGAETRTATTTSEALAALSMWRPDVLLSDVRMRDEGGDALIHAVRSLPAERGGCLRAAALTGERLAEGESRKMAAGYDVQLAKPIEPVALLATVARLAQPASM